MRHIITGKKAEHALEFFIFGLVFTALFVLFLILDAGILLGFLTGLLAGYCFITAWYIRRWRLLWKPGTIVAERDDIPPASDTLTTNDAAERSAEVTPPDSSTLATPTTDEQTQEPIVSSETTPVSLSAQEPAPSEQQVSHEATPQADEVPVSAITTDQSVPTAAPVNEQPVIVEQPTPSAEQTVAEEHEPIPAELALQFAGIDTTKLSLDAYCVKCKTKRMMQHPHLVVLKNGHPAMKGSCPVCGSGLFRIVTKDASWHKYEETTPQE